MSNRGELLLDIRKCYARFWEGHHADEFSRCLKQCFAQKRMSKIETARKAGMSEIYIRQITSGKRKPTRERLIRIGIALQLTVADIQHLLKAAELPVLDPDDNVDSIIMSGIENNMDLQEICYWLIDSSD